MLTKHNFFNITEQFLLQLILFSPLNLFLFASDVSHENCDNLPQSSNLMDLWLAPFHLSTTGEKHHTKRIIFSLSCLAVNYFISNWHGEKQCPLTGETTGAGATSNALLNNVTTPLAQSTSTGSSVASGDCASPGRNSGNSPPPPGGQQHSFDRNFCPGCQKHGCNLRQFVSMRITDTDSIILTEGPCCLPDCDNRKVIPLRCGHQACVSCLREQINYRSTQRIGVRRRDEGWPMGIPCPGIYATSNLGLSPTNFRTSIFDTDPTCPAVIEGAVITYCCDEQCRDRVQTMINAMQELIDSPIIHSAEYAEELLEISDNDPKFTLCPTCHAVAVLGDACYNVCCRACGVNFCKLCMKPFIRGKYNHGCPPHPDPDAPRQTLRRILQQINTGHSMDGSDNAFP